MCFANDVLLGCNPVNNQTGLVLEVAGVCFLYWTVNMYILYDLAVPVVLSQYYFISSCVGAFYAYEPD